MWRCITLLKWRRSIFNILKQRNTGILSSLEEGCLFFLFFFRKLEINFAKVIGIDGFGCRREFEQFWPLLLECRERREMSAPDKSFWGYEFTWNWLNHYGDDATISHNSENLTAYDQDLHLRDIERSHLRVASDRWCGSKVWGKKARALCFLRPSLLRLSLARSLATQIGEVPPVHNISW